MRWKIYYGDGTTYSDRDGPPQDAPGDNLQIILQANRKHGYSTIVGGVVGRVHKDNYWWDADSQSWFNGDYAGLILYLRGPGWKKVIFGGSISNESHEEIRQRAKADPDWPSKTGWQPGEVRL